MPTSSRSYLDHVGLVVFPRAPADLTDPDRCPACFTTLSPSLVCVNCHLDLNHPEAHRLRETSLEVSQVMDARLELIAKIRYETGVEIARLRHAEAATQPGSSHAVPVVPLAAAAIAGAIAAAPPTVTETMAANAPATPAPAPAPAPARTASHSGIQIILLIVGISLLSVGAIFFLIYAFISFGLLWRSAIIAAITLASIIGASEVKRRGLLATAEALSALAVVLVVLDIYSIRANDVLIVGDSAGLSYWGGALLLAATGFMLWHRSSGLQLINIAAYTIFAPAAWLLGVGLASERTPDVAALAGWVALAAATLIHITAAHHNYSAIIERTITLSYAVLALTFGLFQVLLERFLAPDLTLGGWLIALAAIAALHSAAAHSTGLPAGIRNCFATAAGVLTAAAVWTVCSDTIDTGAQVIVVTVALLLVALMIEAVAHRALPPLRRTLLWGSLGAWTVAAVATIVPLAVATAVALQFADQQFLRRTTGGNAPFTLIGDGGNQWALLCIPAALTAVWWATGRLRTRLHVVLAATGVALLTAAPLTGTLRTATLSWLVFAAIALAAIALDRRRHGQRMIHLTIGLSAAVMLAFANLSAWSSHEMWLLTSIVTVLLLLAARYLVDSRIVRAILLGTATLVVILAAAGLGEQLQFATTSAAPNPMESWQTVALMSVALLAASLWPQLRLVSTLERHTLWWIGFASTIAAAAALWYAIANGGPTATAALVLPSPLISLLVGVVLVVTLVMTLLREQAAPRFARYTAAATLAPATAWALDSAARLLGMQTSVTVLAATSAAIVVSGLSMALRMRAVHHRISLISEIGALAIAALSTATAPRAADNGLWLVALLLAVTLLITSISSDGIFGSASLRRYLVWAAAASAIWALWLRLDQTQLESLEAYVLPLAAIIIVLALLTARAELHRSQLSSAPYLVLTGLLVAAVPLALNAANGIGLRTLIVAGLCGALLLTASFTTPEPRLISLWGVTIIGAATGLIAATAARFLVVMVEAPSALPELNSWLLGAVAVLALASYGLRFTAFSPTADAPKTRWTATSEILLGAAIVLLYSVEIALLTAAIAPAGPLAEMRVVTLILIGATLLVLSARFTAAPLTPRLSYLAFAAALAVAAIGLTRNSVVPLEWITVTVGAALLAFAGLRMAQQPHLRSLLWLSPGLLVTLIPTLIATFVVSASPDTQWRIVALGIASVLAIVVGAWRSLQAPLVIGTIVVLIHLSHTFAPTIVALYQLTEWWVWAVIGGAVVVFLGITVERRIRDLKTVNSRIGALR